MGRGTTQSDVGTVPGQVLSGEFMGVCYIMKIN